MVRMHQRGLSAQTIAEDTGRCIATVYRTLSTYHHTGRVSRRILPVGRSRILSPLDVQACTSSIVPMANLTILVS